MSAELFKSVAGIDVTHVPYKGGGPAMIDTISGQVDMCFPVLSAAAPHVKAGKLNAIGVTGAKRSPLMPDVPTLACLLYTSPSPRDRQKSRMPSSA